MFGVCVQSSPGLMTLWLFLLTRQQVEQLPGPRYPVQAVLIPEGETVTIDLTVTNHGLIAANDVTVDLPESDEYYVEPLIREIGLLPAMTSVVVPVKVRAKADGPLRKLAQITRASKTARSASPARKGSVVSREGIPFNLCDFLNGEVVSFYNCSGSVQRNTSFSLKPLHFLLDVASGLGCLTGNIVACVSLACSLGKVSPCVCMFVGIGSAGVGNMVSAAQCIACGSGGGGGGGGVYTGSGSGSGSGQWNPVRGGVISGPSGVSQNRISCTPIPTGERSASKSARTFSRAKSRAERAPSDIRKYGGRIIRYKVMGTR